jgi:large subunit ribosomal protein L17
MTFRKLNRTSAHRRAMHRNMAQSLIEHGQIRTTLEKAKDLKPFVEKLITLARKVQNGPTPAARLSARRQIHVILSDRAIIPKDHRNNYDMMPDAKRERVLAFRSGRRHRTGAPRGKLAFTADSVARRLIETVGVRYADRRGGYTRLIRLSDRRVGDHGALAVLQMVGDEKAPGSLTRPQKNSRRKKADGRYALAVKLAKSGGRKGGEGAVPRAAAGEAGTEQVP